MLLYKVMVIFLLLLLVTNIVFSSSKAIYIPREVMQKIISNCPLKDQLSYALTSAYNYQVIQPVWASRKLLATSKFINSDIRQNIYDKKEVVLPEDFNDDFICSLVQKNILKSLLSYNGQFIKNNHEYIEKICKNFTIHQLKFYRDSDTGLIIYPFKIFNTCYYGIDCSDFYMHSSKQQSDFISFFNKKQIKNSECVIYIFGQPLTFDNIEDEKKREVFTTNLLYLLNYLNIVSEVKKIILDLSSVKWKYEDHWNTGAINRLLWQGLFDEVVLIKKIKKIIFPCEIVKKIIRTESCHLFSNNHIKNITVDPYNNNFLLYDIFCLRDNPEKLLKHVKKQFYNKERYDAFFVKSIRASVNEEFPEQYYIDYMKVFGIYNMYTYFKNCMQEQGNLEKYFIELICSFSFGWGSETVRPIIKNFLEKMRPLNKKIFTADIITFYNLTNKISQQLLPETYASSDMNLLAQALVDIIGDKSPIKKSSLDTENFNDVLPTSDTRFSKSDEIQKQNARNNTSEKDNKNLLTPLPRIIPDAKEKEEHLINHEEENLQKNSLSLRQYTSYSLSKLIPLSLFLILTSIFYKYSYIQTSKITGILTLLYCSNYLFFTIKQKT